VLRSAPCALIPQPCQLKRELLTNRKFKTPTEARSAIFESGPRLLHYVRGHDRCVGGVGLISSIGWLMRIIGAWFRSHPAARNRHC
jgi:hypothetical protein